MATAPVVKREGKDGGITYYTGRDGKQYVLDLNNDRGKDDYRFNNLLRKGNAQQLSNAIQTMLDYGYIPNRAEIEEHTGISLTDKEYDNIRYDLDVFLSKNNINLDNYNKVVKEKAEESMSEQDKAYADYNSYYRDTYSLDEGTTGRKIYDSLLEAERQNALSNMQLADAQQQYSAMQQAETVKAITDQVRAERMEKLRAGMNEAQIANSEMQTLMNNVNTLNQQAQQYNLQRVQAQQQYNNAQHTAYQQWLSNANTMGQIGAAYSASDAGDINQQALRIMRQTGLTYEQSIKLAQGNKQ